jgi:hypothetical protein
MKQVCGELGISFTSFRSTGHAIIPVKGSWNQFEKSRRHLRKDFERTGRRMSEMGPLSIEWFRNGDNQDEALKRILEVEMASWKSINQPPEKAKIDPQILYIFNGCIQIASTVPTFNWGVAVLELNGTAIAHSMFLDYNGYAYLCKTSFNNSYRKYGPGIYINYAVVRELMSKTEIKMIDFMSDFPFSHKWTSDIVPVNRFGISRNALGQLYLIMALLHTHINNPTRKIFVETIKDLAFILKTKISSRKR